MVASHIKEIKQSMLCVTAVYWRDIINTIIFSFVLECESSQHLLFLLRFKHTSKFNISLVKKLPKLLAERANAVEKNLWKENSTMAVAFVSDFFLQEKWYKNGCVC